MKFFIKDPSAILDYSIDWQYWLSTGDQIESSYWTVPDGIVEVSSSYTATAATVWLSGGSVNTDYTIVNTISTSGSRWDQRSIIICVRDR